jgi:hypothetical protein
VRDSLSTEAAPLQPMLGIEIEAWPDVTKASAHVRHVLAALGIRTQRLSFDVRPTGADLAYLTITIEAAYRTDDDMD